MLTDIKHVFSVNPLRPASTASAARRRPRRRPPPLAGSSFEGGC
jgi:hypothetical protein